LDSNWKCPGSFEGREKNLRSRPTSILLKGFIRFVGNTEMGEFGFIFRNEVAGGAL
jgi:hypothetical protein